MRSCKILGLLWYTPKQIRDMTTVIPTAAPKSLMILCHKGARGGKACPVLGKHLLLFHSLFNNENKKMNKYISEFKKFSLQ